MSTISVIVPCYNYGHLLNETLDSLLSQTYLKWECLIIDDGSTDNTREIAKNYTLKDNRIKYSYKLNGGLSSARNEGLRHAKGQYIQFLDADDLLSSNKFENQVRLFEENPAYDIVYSDVRFFTDGQLGQLYKNYNLTDEEWMPKISGAAPYILEALVEGNIMVVNAPLVKASLIRKAGWFDESLKVLEDWSFWLACAMKGGYFYYDNSPGSWVLVRTHRISMSTNRERMYLAESELRRKQLVFFENNSNKINKSKLIFLSEYLAIKFISAGEKKSALKHFYYAARASGRYRYYLGSSLFWLRKSNK